MGFTRIRRLPSTGLRPADHHCGKVSGDGHLHHEAAGNCPNLDAKAAADPDDDGDTKPDLLSDREYLAVAYDRTNQPVKATAICTKAHTNWKTCHCELTETSVKCSDAPTASASKKVSKIIPK